MSKVSEILKEQTIKMLNLDKKIQHFVDEIFKLNNLPPEALHEANALSKASNELTGKIVCDSIDFSAWG